jgi:anti-sigma B factor antagonist
MFNVELSAGDFGGHAVVALYGELDLAGVPGVASHLIAVVAACGPSVIVDLADLGFIDCCGLGVLVRVLKWTRANGGDLLLAAPPEHVRRILRLTGLAAVFSVYPSVEQAARDANLLRPVSAAAPWRPRSARLPVPASARTNKV